MKLPSIETTYTIFSKTAHRQFEEFINALKSNSHNKAIQSWELGDSLQRDVIDPVKILKQQQDQEAFEI